MRKYLISGIRIAIQYQLDHYFNQSIEAYEIFDDHPVDYTIESFLCDHIDLPEGHKKSIRNPHVINDENHRILYAVDKQEQVKSLVVHDHDFKNSKIYINTKATSSLAETEYVLIGVIFMEIALKEGFMAIHASAILYKDQAILFSAPSQTGKSTHANLWKEMFPQVSYLNDDKPLLKVVHDQVMVYGTPIAGQKAINTNQYAPLKSIVFISQGKTNTMTKLTKDSALPLLMKNILRPSSEKNWDMVLKILEFVMDKIPIYTLDATKDYEAVKKVYQVLFKGEEQI